jgi:hypothetical protein
MPHFSKGNHTFEQIETNKHYRLAGWINVGGKWNDALKKPNPRTPEEISAQLEIYELMKKHDAEITVVVQERMHGLEPRDFPAKQRIKMFVNNYENYQSASAPAQDFGAPAAPAPPSPAGSIIDDNDDMGWD